MLNNEISYRHGECELPRGMVEEDAFEATVYNIFDIHNLSERMRGRRRACFRHGSYSFFPIVGPIICCPLVCNLQTTYSRESISYTPPYLACFCRRWLGETVVLACCWYICVGHGAWLPG